MDAHNSLVLFRTNISYDGSGNGRQHLNNMALSQKPPKAHLLQGPRPSSEELANGHIQSLPVFQEFKLELERDEPDVPIRQDPFTAKAAYAIQKSILLRQQNKSEYSPKTNSQNGHD